MARALHVGSLWARSHRRQAMDTSILHVIIAVLALLVVPLGILGALASIAGTDSRDMQHTSSTPTPWKW